MPDKLFERRNTSQLADDQRAEGRSSRRSTNRMANASNQLNTIEMQFKTCSISRLVLSLLYHYSIIGRPRRRKMHCSHPSERNGAHPDAAASAAESSRACPMHSRNANSPKRFMSNCCLSFDGRAREREREKNAARRRSEMCKNRSDEKSDAIN